MYFTFAKIVQLVVSRCGYLHLYTELLMDFLIKDNLVFLGDMSDIWFECDGTALPWYTFPIIKSRHLPIGLLYDIYSKNLTWHITVHTQGYPTDSLLLHNTENNTANLYMSALKQVMRCFSDNNSSQIF